MYLLPIWDILETEMTDSLYTFVYTSARAIPALSYTWSLKKLKYPFRSEPLRKLGHSVAIT